MELGKFRFLTGNQLKILAALLMLIDHIGVMLYPNVTLLRIIGRSSFPVFSFCVAEGCVYTKHKRKYFLGIFLLGILCQLVFYFVQKSTDFGILITFSISILLCYLLEIVKKTVFSAEKGVIVKGLSVVVFGFTLYIIYVFTRHYYVDYGFFGCVLPVFACLLRKVSVNEKTFLKSTDKNWIHVIFLGIGLVLLAQEYSGIQMYSLLAVPLLLLYSGKRGKHPMKLFFYIFYPAHFIVLAGVQQLFFR